MDRLTIYAGDLMFTIAPVPDRKPGLSLGSESREIVCFADQPLQDLFTCVVLQSFLKSLV